MEVKVPSLIEFDSKSPWPKLKVHYAEAYVRAHGGRARVLGIPKGLIGQPLWWNLFLWIFPLTDYTVTYSLPNGVTEVACIYTRTFLGRRYVTHWEWEDGRKRD